MGGRPITGKETKNRGGRPNHRSEHWMVTGGFGSNLGFGLGGAVWFFDFWNLDENVIHTFSFAGLGIDLDIDIWKKLATALKVVSKTARESKQYVEGLKFVGQKLGYEGVEAAASVVSAGAWYRVDSINPRVGRLGNVDIAGAMAASLRSAFRWSVGTSCCI